MTDELDQHQGRVIAILDGVETALRENRQDVAALAQSRWALTRTLTAYALYKHGRVFDPIIAARDSRRAEAARALKAECLRRGDEFRRHVMRWSAADVLGDWDTHRAETLALIARLRVHLDRERAAVRALEQGAAPAVRPMQYGASPRVA